MKVSDFLEKLKEMPQDADLELTKILSMNDEEAYEVFLDFPIVGMAMREDGKELCIIVEHDKTVTHFGKKITKLG